MRERFWTLRRPAPTFEAAKGEVEAPICPKSPFQNFIRGYKAFLA